MPRAWHIHRQYGEGPVCRRENILEKSVIPHSDMFGLDRPVRDEWRRDPDTNRFKHEVTYKGVTRPGCVLCWSGRAIGDE